MRYAPSFHPRALLLATLLLLAPAASARAQDDASSQLGPEALEISTAINQVRADNGLPPLRVHALLNQAAQSHVDDLIANNMYGHYGSDGSSVRTRVSRTGYPSLWVSENWVTSGTPQGAMSWWMNDWIHRVNILDARWDEVSVGAGLVGNGYWIFVTDFADADGQAAVAAAPVAAAAAAVGSPERAPSIQESVPAGGMDYTIKGGDTLLAIGLRYGIEWQDIAVANGIGENSVLRIGQVIRLPGAGAELTAAASGLPAGGKLYTVVAGETLSAIADRFDIAWSDVAAANGIADPSLLQVGMQLRLPGVPEDEALPAPGASAGAVDLAESLSAGYTVRAGDTLFSIATRHNTTWQELASLNGLGASALIQIGQELVVPGSSEAAPTASTAAARTTAPVAVSAASEESSGLTYTTELVQLTPAGQAAVPANSYTVKAGDTIISIAAGTGMGWKKLLELNGLDDDAVIQPGQVLVLD